jgi:hypothetical protein
MNKQTKTVVNQEVDVTSLYFKNRSQLKSFPGRMEYEGREYTFLKSCLEYCLIKGEQTIRLFDLSDGVSNYRLKKEDGSQTWTLLSITQA